MKSSVYNAGLNGIEASPPSRGAWIEITKAASAEKEKLAVAPLAGGVD